MNLDIVRAWKDAEYRESLNEEEQALLPENPAGAVDLTEDDLANVVGAWRHGGHGGALTLTHGNGIVIGVCVNADIF